MNFPERVSDWLHAGQDADFFRTYRTEIHNYSVSFLSVFYEIMTVVFILILLGTFLIPDTPTMNHIKDLTPFGAVYTGYMAICYLLFSTIIRKNIKASFLFIQISLVLFGVLLLWLDFCTAGSLAVFIPVYFALFPMLLTVPVPVLMLDLAILYIISLVGTVVFKEPRIAIEDIINITICLIAGFFIGCKNIRSKLAEIKTLTYNELLSTQQKSVINALMDEYDCLAIADYDKDTINKVLVSENFIMNLNALKGITILSKLLNNFADLAVHPDDKKRYLETIEPNNVFEHMKDNRVLVINYRIMNNGTEEYVQSKFIKDPSLPADSHRYVLCHRSIDNEVRMEQMISDALLLANHDPLTGVNNRTAYNAEVARIQQRLDSGSQKEAGIAMFDVNWLKETNDYNGHDAGDELLRNVCSEICSIFKHSPVYRIGGDEFAVLLSPYDIKIRDKLMERARNTTVRTEKGPSFASGMAVYAKPDESFHDTIKRADEEMYKNKREIKDPYTPIEQRIF